MLIFRSYSNDNKRTQRFYERWELRLESGTRIQSNEENDILQYNLLQLSTIAPFLPHSGLLVLATLRGRWLLNRAEVF